MQDAPTTTHARAGVLSVGDELTLGQTLDTNSRWIASRLMDLGIVPVEHVTVSDDEAAQRDALLALASRVDVIICTGGLGPTADDLTRQALAGAMHDTLVEDPIAFAQVEAFFASRGRVMSPLNRVQALRPTRASMIPNLQGTAPGLQGRIVSARQASAGCDVFCLPGPPREMQPMFDAHVAPRLRPAPGRTVRTRVVHAFGIGESDLAQRMGTLMDRARVPMVGTTASGGVVSVRMRYEGTLPPSEAEAKLDDTERLVREAAGEYIFGRAQQTLTDVALALLRERGETVGTVESCTGGGLGELFTRVPGASSCFLGSLVTYSNALKESLAGVPAAMLALDGPGAVSPETALAMAQGGLEKLGVHHALAITGIAGPDGAVPARAGRAAKPVGLVYIARASRRAVAAGKNAGGKSAGGKTTKNCDTEVRSFHLVGDRDNIREWACKCALAMLWQHLAGLPPMKLLRQVDG